MSLFSLSNQNNLNRVVQSSIMVGVTIGASEGDSYIPLLIGKTPATFSGSHILTLPPLRTAIVFHQMFEGLGLGARIALLKFSSGQGWKKWLMSAAFAVSSCSYCSGFISC